MAPLSLEGDTLGSKHRNHNKLLEKAIADGVKPEKLNPEDSDLENLLKIDIASRQMNVEYILEVLKSEDMLYVSRAIKQSLWLVTEQQFADIINPDYLHTQLFPQMTTKASHKLMLHIRLNLKNAARIDEFYKYYKKTDLKKAQKWLSQCSPALIEEELKARTHDIGNHQFKRLSERGFTVFKQALDAISYWKKDKIERAMFLLKTDTELFLNTVENLEIHQMPKFGPKATQIIMAKCPQKIQDKFEIYAHNIHLPTFVKHMKKEQIKGFMLKHMENDKLRYWFNYDNVKIFIKHMPNEGKFEFVKEFFIERPFKDPPIAIPYHKASVFDNSNCSSNIYRWYRFAPFDVAFSEIKKLIRIESSPDERNSMFSVVLFCAKRNPQHVHELLQYYHDKHMNEPFKFKLTFVNKILSMTDTHNYDKKTWTLLNTIFYSMEVYSENSDNFVQPYIEAIIAYNILHGEEVPEIVAKKFSFNSMNKLQSKLKVEEKPKIFNYLYNIQMTKLRNKTVANETHFSEARELIENIMYVLIDWKRDLVEFPEILDKIRELIKIKQENDWKISLSSLYTKNNKWRKAMFEESLALYTCEQSLINAIKHDPKLLLRNKAEVDSVRYNDNATLTHLLRKLRIYFPQSVTSEWTTDYLAKLNETNGHKALTRAICTLLPQKPLTEILQKYAPTETKINWSEDDELLLSLRKYFAKYMHLARPLVSPNIVLCYARGDYLQFALPSLTAVAYNISSQRSREMLSKLLESPVSVQKHGLTLAFNKLQPREIKQVFADLWKRNNNASIRSALFKRTFELLCKQKDDKEAENIWDLLSTFIDNLSSEEDKTIYLILSNNKRSVDLVPFCVRGKFCMKSYKCLSSLPPKADYVGLVDSIKSYFKKVMEYLDYDFITDVVQKDLENFTKTLYAGDILSSYMLCVKDEEAQTLRYNKVFLPLLERCLPLWEEPDKDGCCIVKINMTNVLEELRKGLFVYVFMEKMVLPIKLFADIANKLEEKLPTKTTYVLLRTWKLTATLMKLLDSHKDILDAIEVNKTQRDHYYMADNDSQWNPFFLNVTKDFAQACINYLKADLEEYFPSINLLFGNALLGIGSNVHGMVYFDILNNILDNCDKCPKCFLMVLKSFPSYWGCEANDIVKQIRDKIESHPSLEVKMHFYREKVAQNF
ncbi:uncharacterized protein LOC113226006 [Hyposmocoma kahamanoa]|uniref:uncharacterized protein LOC113226006 n=1 Tax=Hyposmocoma kahamanoa TaxID=1477025 RepID=UPI000E6D88AC|nr:uncharacterized protein LOC113226006 [Hyposmocoma kahamanoa]XP_026314295.1 uncharacterized protein LOC113226006 [Hyposmocoma kahamanoa]